MIDWNTRVVLSYRAEAWRDVWHVSFKIGDGIDLDSAKDAIEAEVKAITFQGNHAATRVGQRPKFLSINTVNRTVVIEESQMLHD